MTPSGTRTRSIVIPFGLAQRSVTAPDRIAKITHHLHSRRHGLDALVIERKPIEKCGGDARRLCFRQILGICRENVAAAGAALIGHGGECVVLLPGGRERKHACGILGPAPEGVHHGRKIARALNRFEGHSRV